MLEVKNVTVGYDGVEVLRDFSFALAPGELVALVGDNGCGKSTLGRVMCAAQLVDEGSVVVDGHDPSVSELERLHVRSFVGRLSQDPLDQIVSSLVFDEIAFGPRNLGLDESEVERRVFGALELVGMSSYIDRVTTELSGGEQQRIALAGVLAMHTRYLVLDEPTAQLDPMARDEFRALFVRLSRELGAGVVLITHDSSEIALADRVVDMSAVAGSSEASHHPQDHAVSEPLSPSERVGARALLELEGVSFSYGFRPVLTGASLRVHAGEVVMIVGASGAGKSTLASIAAGLMPPCGGSVRVAGAAPVPGVVGLAFQQPESQFFLDTVYDEIAYAPRNLGCEEREVDRRVRKAARSVGLEEELLQASPFELSGGQARRVALASVLSLDASVYIFDEPSAALDGGGRSFAHRFVARLAREGRAVVVITHDVEEWRPYATRGMVLRDGALCSDVAPHALQSPYAPQKADAPRNASDAPESSFQGDSGPLTAFGAYLSNAPASCVDARVKLILLLLASGAVFAAATPLMLAIWFMVLLVCLAAARMDLRRVVCSMRPVAFVLAFTLLANLISCDGRATVDLVGPLGIDPAGGLRGLMAIARIVLLVGFSLVVASSTTATQLSDACVRLLSPLSRFGVPVGPLGTVLALALRFIPLVSEELNRIRLAQRARGAQFDEGSLMERIRVWASVLTPLMIGLFRRADRLAEAMSARCYDAVSAGRLPAAHPLAARDRKVLVAGAGAVLALLALGAIAKL